MSIKEKILTNILHQVEKKEIRFINFYEKNEYDKETLIDIISENKDLFIENDFPILKLSKKGKDILTERYLSLADKILKSGF